MQAPHPHRLAGLAQDQGIAGTHPAGQRRASHHHPRTGNSEGAVDSQAKTALRTALPHSGLRLQQGLAQRVDALPAKARHRELPRPGIGPWRQQLIDLRLHLGQARRLDAVALADRHQCLGDTQQLDDCQVLTCLRHDAIVCRHHQQHHVYAMGPGQHVVDKPLVAHR